MFGKSRRRISVFVLFCFLTTSAGPVWAAEAPSDFEIVHGQLTPEKPVAADSQAELAVQQAENTVIVQAVANHSLSPASPLSPVDPADPSRQEDSSHVIQASAESSEASILSEVSQAQGSFLTFNAEAANLPPEANFISRLSDNVFQAEFDDYFKSLLRELLPPDLTSQFEPIELVNVELAAIRQRIQEGLAGLYDFVVFFPTEVARRTLTNLSLVAPDGVQGFGVPEKNNIEGIGLPENDPQLTKLNETFGPLFNQLFSPFVQALKGETALQGSAWIDLNAISSSPFTSFGYKMFVLLQEIAHRWGVHLSSGGKLDHNPLGILGRDEAHWNFFFNGGNSPMDGISWRDNGDGTFTLQKIWGANFFEAVRAPSSFNVISEFNDFDLYAMGLLPAPSVRSSFVIDQPTFQGKALTQENALELFSDINFVLNPTIQGTRREVTIDQITQIEGARNPSSFQSQKDFKIAFVVLRDQNEDASTVQETIDQVNLLASALPSKWREATRTLSTMALGQGAASIELFRNQVLNLYDQFVSLIQGKRRPTFDSAQGRAEAALVKVTELETQLAEVESLLTQLTEVAKAVPEIRDQLGNLPTEISDRKKMIQELRGFIENPTREANSLGQTVTANQNQIVVKLSQISSAGILPLGFGSFIDTKLNGLDILYERLTSDFQAAANTVELKYSELKNGLADALNRLDEIAVRSPQQLKVKAENLMNSVVLGLEALDEKKKEATSQLNGFIQRKNDLKIRLEKVMPLLDQIALGPHDELKDLLVQLVQYEVPSQVISEAFSNAQLTLSSLKNNLLPIIELLGDIISGRRSLSEFPQAVTMFNELKKQFDSQNDKAEVDSLVNQSRFEIQNFETNSRNLSIEVTKSLDDFLFSFLSPAELPIESLAGLRSQAVNLRDSMGEKRKGFTDDLDRIIDPDIRAKVVSEFETLTTRFNSLSGKIDQDVSRISQLEAVKVLILKRRSEIHEVDLWIRDSGFLSDSVESFESRFKQLAEIKDDLSTADVQNLASSVESVQSALQGSLGELKQLETELENFRSKLKEIFKEQENQIAEEASLDQAVNELRNNFSIRKEEFEQVVPHIKERIGETRDFLKLLGNKIELLGQVLPEAGQMASQTGKLLAGLNDLLTLIEQISQNRIGTETALSELELAQVKMNQLHSLLSLREAKELLTSTEEVFHKTDDLLKLEGQMDRLEGESIQIKDALRTEFLILNQRLEGALSQLLNQYKGQIENLLLRFSQAKDESRSLRSRLIFLTEELENLDGIETKEAFLNRAERAQNQLDQLDHLIQETELLFPGLQMALNPLADTLVKLTESANVVRTGNLFSEETIAQYSQAQMIMDDFSKLEPDHPLTVVERLNDSELSPFLNFARERVNEINAFLHPPVVIKEPDVFGYFEIPAIRGYKFPERSIYFLKPLYYLKTASFFSIFGISNKFISEIEIEKSIKRKVEAEERERLFRQRLNRLLRLKDIGKKIIPQQPPIREALTQEISIQKDTIPPKVEI